jgi:hypothetical protein
LGKLRYAPNANENGSDSFTYKANDGTADSNTATVSVTINPVNDAPSVSKNNGADQQVQFSDAITTVTISATDVDSSASSLLAGTSWKKSTDASFQTTQPLGGLTLTPTGSTSTFPRTWTLTGQAMVPEGVYIVRVTVGDGQASSYVDVTITVTKEDAQLEYSGDVFKNTASANTNTATFNLAAVAREAGVAGGPTESPVSLGNALGGKQLKFTVFKFGGAQYATCTGTIPTTATSTGSASCQVTLAVDDPYTLNVELVTNGHYVAPVESQALVLSYPGTGFTSGGGWLNEPNLGSRSNFGFTVKYLKNGNLQGNSLYIYRKTVAANQVAYGTGFLPAGDYNWQVKSNSWAGGGLNQSCTTTTPKKCTATFSGKSNIAAINRKTGIAYSLGGNYNYQVDVDDYSEPGSSPGAGPDAYAIRVWSDTGGQYYKLGQPRIWDPSKIWDPTYSGYGLRLAITGGNIQVRP